MKNESWFLNNLMDQKVHGDISIFYSAETVWSVAWLFSYEIASLALACSRLRDEAHSFTIFSRFQDILHSVTIIFIHLFCGLFTESTELRIPRILEGEWLINSGPLNEPILVIRQGIINIMLQ